MWICLLLVTMVTVTCAENIGNNVVNCAACQTVEQQVTSWDCKVNCEVTQGLNGESCLRHQNKKKKQTKTTNRIMKNLRPLNHFTCRIRIEDPVTKSWCDI